MLGVSLRNAQELGDEPDSRLWLGVALTAGKQHRQHQQDLHRPLTWAWAEKQGTGSARQRGQFGRSCREKLPLKWDQPPKSGGRNCVPSHQCC